ncbi:MAG: Antilisterial bacteriocin subtilosin biosynthesis protein AlbA [Parcubacteria group bacterium ADurb.Bin316]|nr:MAG: Antilisterial bacteriocin subtilosin biosynthesis protein AlbA [Parcubacteria group bacterium ADurb.Bin316]
MIVKLQKKLEEINHILWSLKKYYLIDRDHIFFTLKVLQENILQFFGFERLGKIFLAPSYQCNADCPHCFEKFPNSDQAYLYTDDCKNIINQFKELGGYLVYFCGGEFLMRDDAIELIQYCYDKGMATSITTNGIILDEELIDKLKKAGLTLLAVSIDSADHKKHDLLRGEGTFAKAKNGLLLAKQRGIRTQIWTYMTKTHLGELDGIGKLCREVDADFVYVFFAILSGHLFDCSKENFSYSEREEIRKRYAWEKPIVLEFPKESWLCKGGGKEFICVMPTGDVTYCPPVPYSYGNVKKRALREILKDVRKDYKRLMHCATGQCPVNFSEYREECNAEFIYRK